MRRLKKITLVNSIVAVLLLLTFALLAFDRFHAVAVRDTGDDLEECMMTFREILMHKGEGFRIVDGKLLVGSYVINGNFEVPDKVQKIFGETATVFMGDVRVSTNVRQEDGSRAVGTRLEGPAYDAVFRQGKSYRGGANILGIPYFTAYDPIRDESGKIIGALYVGIKKSEFLAHYAVLKAQLGLILLGLLAVFTVIIALFYRLTKQVEYTREADHRFLQTLIDTIPNPVFYKDVQGRFLGYNKAFARLFGYSAEQLLGKTVFDILPQPQASSVHQEELELLRKQELLVEEVSLAAVDGSPRDAILFKAAFPSPDGSNGGLVGTLLDITERKQAEVKLRESERYLADIIQFYPDATMVIDSEGKVTAWNRAMEEVTGVLATEMLGRGDYEYAVPFYGERRPILIDLVTRPVAEVEKKYPHIERLGDMLVAEAYILNRQGGEIYFHGIAAPLRNSDGKIVGAIESIRDISEQKKAQDALAERENFLSNILNSIQDGITILDRELRIVQVNSSFEGHFPAGGPLVGRNCYEAFHGLQAPCESCPSLRTLESGKPDFRVFSPTENGTEVWLEQFTYPLFDSLHEHVTGVIEVTRDITKRKLAEDKLHKFSLAVEQSPFSIVITDTSGTIEFVNSAFSRITQYSSAEAIGKNPRILKSGLTAPEVYTELWQTITAGREWHGEWCDRKKSGELFWEAAKISPITDGAGNITNFMAIKEDITEKRRVERALAASEERFRTLVETTSDWVWEVDGKGVYLYASPQVFDLLGYEPAEVVGRHVLDFKPPKEADRVAALVETIIAQAGQFVAMETVNRHKDGRLVVLESSGIPVFAEDGSLKGYRGIDRDITERKYAEVALREKEEKLRTITNTAQDAIIMIDDNSHITYWNPAAEQIFGYSTAEAQGEELHTLIAPQRYRAAYREGFARFRETGEGAAVGKTIELDAIRKGGEEFPVELSMSAIQLRGKWHAVGILRDITVRKRAEAETLWRGSLVERLNSALIGILQDARIYGGDIDVAFRVITESSARAMETVRVSIWFYGPDNGSIECKDLYETGSGTHSEGIVLKAADFPVYFSELEKECSIVADDAALDPRTREFAESYLKPHGITSMLDVPLRVAGRVIGVICHEHVGPQHAWSVEEQSFVMALAGFTAMVIETHERIMAEEQIRKMNAELEVMVEERTSQLVATQEELVRKEKLSILGQLSGSVGHELRNPLGVMSNAVYFLKMVHADGDTTTREYLDIIKTEIDSSLRIITDLLDFARTNMPQIKMVTVRQLVDESLGKCTIPESVTFRAELPDTLPLLSVDPLQMGQVLQNLITNAVQAMPAGGDLTINAGVKEETAEDKRFVVINVADTGDGVTPENMKKLFQPLFTTKAKGIGLGLVVCRNLVTANGGRIEVVSEAGKGTTFTVTLPASGDGHG
jgi:PAS domain S-box-containing protein